MGKIFSQAALFFVLAICTLGFCQSIAWADSGAVSLSAVALPSGYAGLALLVLTTISWASRKFSGWAPLHTVGGAAVVGVLSGLVPALVQAITSHGLSVAVVETAALGALLSYFSGDNPSNTPTQQAQVVAKMRVTAAVNGIVDTAPNDTVGVATTVTMTPPKPTDPPKAASLLPLIFVAGLALVAGCPAHTGTPTGGTVDGGVTPYSQAYLQCIEGTGVTLAESAALQAWGVLDSGASEAAIISSLEGLGIQDAAQLAQIAGTCALQAWNVSHPVVPNVKPTPAQAALRVYYARHPQLARK